MSVDKSKGASGASQTSQASSPTPSTSSSAGITRVGSSTQTPQSQATQGAGAAKPRITEQEAKHIHARLKTLLTEINGARSRTEFVAARASFEAIVLNEVHTHSFFGLGDTISALRRDISQMVREQASIAMPDFSAQPLAPASTPRSLQELTQLADTNIQALNDGEMARLVTELHNEFNALIANNDIDEARSNFDFTFVLIRDRYQAEPYLPDQIANLMAQMETQLILNGAFLDEAKDSLIPDLTLQQIQSMSHEHVNNLLIQLYTQAGLNSENVEIAAAAFNRAEDYLAARLLPDQTLPIGLQLLRLANNVVSLTLSDITTLFGDLRTEFSRLIRSDQTDEARNIFNSAVTLLQTHFQNQRQIPAVVGNLMDGMEIDLILNGVFFDQARYSALPNLTDQELLALPERNMLNLIQHLYTQVAENLDNVSLATRVFARAQSYVNTRYGPIQNIPAEVQSMTSDIRRYAAQSGLQL